MHLGTLRAGGLQRSPIVVAALVGLIAGVPSGVVLQLGTEFLPILGGIVGAQSLIVGWIVHLVLSTAFGALFGWHLEWPVFRTLTTTLAGTVFWGIIFAVVWYAYVMIGVVIPGIVEYLEGSGEGTPVYAIPGVAGGPLLTAGVFAFAYLAYDAILGGGYAILEDVRAEPEPRGPDGGQGRRESR